MSIGIGSVIAGKERRGVEKEVAAKLKQIVREVLMENPGVEMSSTGVCNALRGRGVRAQFTAVEAVLTVLADEELSIKEWVSRTYTYVP